MFKKIVIGIDGTEGGDDALALARRLSGPDTELIGVSVAVVEGHPSRGVNLDYDGRVHADAEQRLAAVLAREPDVRGEVTTAHSVGVALHAAAEHHGAELIAVGSCRRGMLGRIFAGDDALSVLREAPFPVAVAPRQYALTSVPLATVGVGWDGGEQSGHALDVAQAIAADLGAEVHAVAVVGLPVWPVVEGSVATLSIDDEVEAMERRMAQLDVPATITTGTAADELAKFAAEVDLLVVGSRRQGRVARVLLGSTSEQLTGRCVRPLLVVPRVHQPATTGA